MFTLAVGLLLPFMGKWVARAVIVSVIAAAIAVPFVYTYNQGYSSGREACETRHRAAFEAAQREADLAADALQDETLRAETDDTEQERVDETAAPTLAEAIERGASDAQCIDADSLRHISAIGAGSAQVAATGTASARKARGN